MSGAVDWAGMKRRLAAMQAAIERDPADDPDAVRAILARRAERLAAERESGTETAPSQSYLQFALGGGRFALGLAVLGEILAESDIVPLPGTPDFVAGIVTLRGHLLTVIDLAPLFGLTGRSGGRGKVLTLSADGRIMGLRVDLIEGLRIVADGLADSGAQGLSEACRRYLIGVTGDGAVLLDGMRILTDKALIVGGREQEGGSE